MTNILFCNKLDMVFNNPITSRSHFPVLVSICLRESSCIHFVQIITCRQELWGRKYILRFRLAIPLQLLYFADSDTNRHES